MSDDWSAAEAATAAGRLASEKRQRAAQEAVWEYRLRWGHEPSTGPELAWRADRAKRVGPSPAADSSEGENGRPGPNFGPTGDLTDEQRAAIDRAARRMGYLVEEVPEPWGGSCLRRCMEAVERKYAGHPPEDVVARVVEAHR